MAGRTTAYVIVGQHSVGPFQSREWKARHGVALIEKHRPVWMPGPIGHSLGEPMPLGPIYLPWGLDTAGELLVVLASVVVRDESVLNALAAIGGVRDVTDERGAVHRWLVFNDDALSDEADWPYDLVAQCAEAVRDRARLGVVRLEPYSLLGGEQVLKLRELGLDVDEFTAVPVSSFGDPSGEW